MRFTIAVAVTFTVLCLQACVLLSAASAAPPPPPPGWNGQRRAPIPADTVYRLNATLFYQVGAAAPVLTFFANANPQGPQFARAVDVLWGYSPSAGWVVEEYHADAALYSSPDPTVRALAYTAVGYAEGFVNAGRIWSEWAADAAAAYPAADPFVTQFFSQQMQWFTTNYSNAPLTALDEAMAGQLAVFNGRVQGYNDRVSQQGAATGGFPAEYGPLPASIAALSNAQFWFFSAAEERAVLAGLSDYASGRPKSQAATDFSSYAPWYPYSSPLNVPNTAAPQPIAFKSTGICTAQMLQTPLTKADLLASFVPYGAYATLNYSVTIVTLETQTASIRTSAAQLMGDGALTSNGFFVCSAALAAFDYRALLALTPQSIPHFLARAYVAAATSAQAAVTAAAQVTTGAPQPRTWMAVNFSSFQPVSATKGSLPPGSALLIDTYPASPSFYPVPPPQGFDVSANLTAGQVVVAGITTKLPLILPPSTVPMACPYCALVAAAQGPTRAEFANVAASAKGPTDVLTAGRFNQFNFDPDSVLPPPFQPVRCAGLAIGARLDLNNNNATINNNTWGMQARCALRDEGTKAGLVTSWSSWRPDKALAAGTSIGAYPFLAIVGPPYENPDTPPYVVSLPGQQPEAFWFAPVNFSNTIAPDHQVVPRQNPSQPAEPSDGAPSASGTAGVVLLSILFAGGIFVGALLARHKALKRRTGQSWEDGQVQHQQRTSLVA
jgi:hypothetical protein